MQITREELNPCTIKLHVVCTPEQVQSGYDRALKTLAKQVKLPGFRPGHAPKAMVAQMIDRDELKQEAAEVIVNESFRKALDQEAIQIDSTTRPGFELKLLEETACEYVVKVALPPKIELAEYKGLAIDRPKVQVTDAEVDYQLDELRKRKSVRESITDRGAQEGDIAVVNIRLDGQEGDGRTFMTVVGQTFTELDATLVGMHLEEMKSVELTFPANFQEKDWATQTHHCQVTLNSVSAVKMPPVDDEFAKEHQLESVDVLRETLHNGIRRAKDDMVRELMFDQALEHLQKESEIFVSDNMWENLAMRRLEETAQEQQKAGKSLEQYAAENGMTTEQLVTAWQEKAKLHVERALVIREIFTKEAMKLTNIELNSELREMSMEYQVEPEQLLTMLKQNEALEELHFRAISRKVADFLIANAKITETELN
ncbi:MAG: trigger factor [Fimbriimonas sp.]